MQSRSNLDAAHHQQEATVAQREGTPVEGTVCPLHRPPRPEATLDVLRKEAARQSATDAGPQAFYDELALSRLKRWGGTSSESQASP